MNTVKISNRNHRLLAVFAGLVKALDPFFGGMDAGHWLRLWRGRKKDRGNRRFPFWIILRH
jgi:hypothetical protein